MSDILNELRQGVYQQGVEVERLRREAFEANGPAEALFDELAAAETLLAQAEAELAAEEEADPESGLLVGVGPATGAFMVLGAQTTGLSAEVHLRMAQVPTAIYHLFDAEQNPLISCKVHNHSDETRRLRVTSAIQGYSAQAIHTAEVDENNEVEFNQSPTLFPANLRELNELQRATLSVLVEDLDSGKVESHSTHPLWLLARTTAPLVVRDPKTGGYQDLTPYLGAFVTPNAPALMTFLRAAADLHPQKRLVGYQGDKSTIEPQVRALFEALKQKAGITYVNSVIAFSPDQGTAVQRVRLPRESLADRQANCIDGTVLFASLLEAISLSPALVLVPGHAFLAWETWKASNEWRFLETTMIGSNTFDEARAQGETHAARYQALAKATNKPLNFRLWPMRTLRAEKGVLPME